MSDQSIAPETTEQSASAAVSETATLTMKEFEEKVLGDPQFAKEYLQAEDPIEFAKRYVKADDPGAQPPNPETPQADQKSVAEGPQGKPATDLGNELTLEINGVSVKIPKEDFGTYLSGNKTPAEAVLAALKGNREKDVTIGVLRRSQLPDDEEISLRQRIERARRVTTAKDDDEVTELGSVDLSVIERLEKDPNLFDEANQKDVVALLRSMGQTIVKQNEAIKKSRERTQEIVKADATADYQDAVAELRAKRVRRESDQIESLLNYDPNLKPTKYSTFTELDSAVADFSQTLNRMEPNGYVLYFADSPEGEAFRQRCAVQGIALPDDFDRHQTVMRVRRAALAYEDNVRKDFERINGRKMEDFELPPIAKNYLDFYDESLRYKPTRQSPGAASNGQEESIRRQQEIAAAADAAGRAKELPNGLRMGTLTMDKIPIQEGIRLFERDPKTYTDDEVRVAAQFCEQEKIPMCATLADRWQKMKGG